MIIEELLELVQVLSRGEKRHFQNAIKGNTNNKSKSKYEELFEKLNQKRVPLSKLSEYNSKYDSDTRSYLAQKILESMRTYRDKRKVERKYLNKEIKGGLIDAKFLFEKGLYELSLQRLLKVKRDAKSIHHHLALQEANFLILDIYTATVGDPNTFDIPIKKVLHEIEEQIECIQSVSIYMKIYGDLFSFIKKRINFTEEQKRTLTKQYYHYLKEGISFSSEISQQRFLVANAIFFRLQNDGFGTYEYLKKALAWWDKKINQSYKKEEKYRYLITLANFLNSIILTIPHPAISDDDHQLKEILVQNAQEVLKKLEEESANFEINQLKKVEPGIYANKLNLCFLLNDFEKAKILIESELETKRKAYSLKDQKVFLAQYASVFFRLKDYSSCRKWIKQFFYLSKKNPGIREEIEPNLLLLDIVASLAILEGKIENQVTDVTPDYLECKIEEAFTFYSKKGLRKDAFPVLALHFLKQINHCSFFQKRQKMIDFCDFIKKNKQQICADDILFWLKNHAMLMGLNIAAGE